jgi:hypothetical protein
VDHEDADPPVEVGPGDDDPPVEAARALQRRVGTSGRLVAAMRMTPSLLSNPSISTRAG